MTQASLLFGPPDTSILPGSTNVPPQPLSFADFRFNTIGQQPELLKRISAPEPDYLYHDHSSPEPSIDHSVQSTPTALSRPTLLETLAAQTDSQEATMTDASDDMVVDTHPVQPSGTLFISNHVTPRGLSHFSTTRLDPARPPIGWSGNTPTPMNPPLSNPQDAAPSGSPSSQAHPHVSNSPQVHQDIAEISNHISTLPVQPVPATLDSVSIVTSFPTQVNPSPIPSNVELPRSSPSPTHEYDSPYTALRTLQSQLFSSLSSLNPPQVDTSHALLLVQAANSHSANALSIAHRVQTLSQQALASARDAATVAQECLATAEQAKAHASAAVSAVEHIGNPDFGPLKNEWEWKTVIAELRDGLSALGQLLGEREGEEAAHRREMERTEKERKNKESVESAMRMTNGSLPPQIIRAMSVEVARRTAAAEAHVRSSGTSVKTNSHEVHDSSSIDSRASAELEADAARRAWSLEHRTPPSTDAKSRTFTLPTTAEQRETEEEKRRTMIAEHKDQEPQIQQLQAQGPQKQQEDEAEVRRVQDLKRQKLEVAQFHVKERERQEMLQKEEAARRAAEGERLQKEADLLEEQTRKGKEAEARARMEKAQADKQARLKQQEKLEKQKFEEAAKEQARLEQQSREEAAREQAQLEQQRAEQAAGRRAQEEVQKAEEAANAALMKVYEEAQALEEQKRREVEELKQKKRAEEVTRARELEAEDKRLREEQEKKRQEVMVNKQRATAETAARILADRAQKEKEKNGGISTTPKSISPPIALSAVIAPPASQSPLIHPLPLPVHQSPSSNIGNLTAKKTVAPQTGDASKPRGRAISGGVKLGTDELPQPQPSQPRSPTGPTLPLSPTLVRSTAFAREKVPPIPKRSARTSLQIPPQPVESNIPPAKRLGKTQPPADGRSSLSVKPPSMCRSDMSIGSASDIASSVPVTPGTKSTPLPTIAGDRGTPIPMTPDMPALTISSDREEPPNNNNWHVHEPAPEPVSVHHCGEDRGNLHVIPKSKASHASPQAQAANLRFVKDEGGVLWNKYLKPDPSARVKLEPYAEGDELPTVQVKKGSGSTSPVIPLVETAEPESPTMPSPVVPPPIQPASVTSSSTVHKPNPAALHSSSPNPRPHNSATANSAGSKTLVSSPTVPTSNALTAPTTLPPKPKLPKFKKTKILHVDNNQLGPNNSSTTNIPATNKGPNAAHAPFTELPVRPPRSILMPFDPRVLGNDPLSLFEDSSAIAPVIQGDGGWDSWVGTPPRLSGSSYDRAPAGSTWSDVEPGLDSAPRRSASRRIDHYSPPPSRAPIHPRRPERALPVQDQKSVSGPRPAQPRIQSNSGPPQDRIPLRTPPPPPERLPVLGKRRYREDDNLQRQPIRRQRQSNEREDQIHRPDLARTPPLPERRSTTPERSGGLQSRIGVQREDRTYGGDVYRPTHAPYTAAPARTQPRSYDSYNPAYTPEPSYLDYSPTSIRDSYSNLGRYQVTDTRPDLLDRMDTGSTQSFNPFNHHNRGRPPFAANGSSRGRRGRGGSAGGGRPLEQRLSNSYNNNSLSLAHRLESPPRYH